MEKVIKYRSELSGQIITFTISEELTKKQDKIMNCRAVRESVARANERLSKLNAESRALAGLD